MERLKGLGLYQKVILLLILVMALVFGVIYARTVSQEGFAYRKTILVPSVENEKTAYSGIDSGTPMAFTVSASKAVTFRYGDKVYGPYTVKEDATAVPPGREYMKGIEVYCGEKLLFRGGAYKSSDFWLLIHENESDPHLDFHATFADGITRDENGNIVDPMEPSIQTVLEVMSGPEITHKGNWAIWFLSVFLCIVTAITILFADELFQLGLSFRIRNAEYAEPSDWEIAGRYISWTLIPVCALVLFIVGLQ